MILSSFSSDGSLPPPGCLGPSGPPPPPPRPSGPRGSPFRPTMACRLGRRGCRLGQQACRLRPSIFGASSPSFFQSSKSFKPSSFILACLRRTFSASSSPCVIWVTLPVDSLVGFALLSQLFVCRSTLSHRACVTPLCCHVWNIAATLSLVTLFGC